MVNSETRATLGPRNKAKQRKQNKTQHNTAQKAKKINNTKINNTNLVISNDHNIIYGMTEILFINKR
jgi:uncharacterized protein YgiM (DUF1202 family)